MKTALVCGAGGFIGSHLVKRLKDEGYYVVGVDLKHPEFSKTKTDKFYKKDLRSQLSVEQLFKITRGCDEVYQLAADMGGAGYIFTGDHDAEIMSNSALINLNIANACIKYAVGKLFYSSSACIYPQQIQESPNNPGLKETDSYPANPDSRYGWEKLFSEQLFAAYEENYGLCIRIARFHNVYGPEGTFMGGREKSIAAISRKVSEAKDGDAIEIWGDGNQTRSFLYIDDCIEGIRRIMNTPSLPFVLNLGSDEQVSINKMAKMIIEMSGKKLLINHIDGPIGVRGRSSDNTLIKDFLGWSPSAKLEDGLRVTFNWIFNEMQK